MNIERLMARVERDMWLAAHPEWTLMRRWYLGKPYRTNTALLMRKWRVRV